MLGNNNSEVATSLLSLFNASIKSIQEGCVQLFRNIIINYLSLVSKWKRED